MCIRDRRRIRTDGLLSERSRPARSNRTPSSRRGCRRNGIGTRTGDHEVAGSIPGRRHNCRVTTPGKSLTPTRLDADSLRHYTESLYSIWYLYVLSPSSRRASPVAVITANASVRVADAATKINDAAPPTLSLRSVAPRRPFRNLYVSFTCDIRV